jgi:hypothetical protein
MEQASVAAFARFSLELLSLGAPAELVELATQAMGDETRHARVCFGFARAYGGVDVGPGPMPIGGALATQSTEDRIRIAFLEACVGETVAALEVAEAAERASEPAVVEALRRIAADETRHAALGFRFVRWALSTLSPSRRAALEENLWSTLLATVDVPPPKSAGVRPEDHALTRHGLLPEYVRHEVRKAALSDVVVPCVLAMFEGRSGATRGPRASVGPMSEARVALG